jgi:hypothetical protein
MGVTPMSAKLLAMLAACMGAVTAVSMICFVSSANALESERLNTDQVSSLVVGRKMRGNTSHRNFEMFVKDGVWISYSRMAMIGSFSIQEGRLCRWIEQKDKRCHFVFQKSDGTISLSSHESGINAFRVTVE